MWFSSLALKCPGACNAHPGHANDSAGPGSPSCPLCVVCLCLHRPHLGSDLVFCGCWLLNRASVSTRPPSHARKLCPLLTQPQSLIRPRVCSLWLVLWSPLRMCCTGGCDLMAVLLQLCCWKVKAFLRPSCSCGFRTLPKNQATEDTIQLLQFLRESF